MKCVSKVPLFLTYLMTWKLVNSVLDEDGDPLERQLGSYPEYQEESPLLEGNDALEDDYRWAVRKGDDLRGGNLRQERALSPRYQETASNFRKSWSQDPDPVKEEEDLKELESWNDSNNFNNIDIDEADPLEKEYVVSDAESLDQGLFPMKRHYEDGRDKYDMTSYVDDNVDGDRLSGEYRVDISQDNSPYDEDPLEKEYSLGEAGSIDDNKLREHRVRVWHHVRWVDTNGIDNGKPIKSAHLSWQVHHRLSKRDVQKEQSARRDPSANEQSQQDLTNANWEKDVKIGKLSGDEEQGSGDDHPGLQPILEPKRTNLSNNEIKDIFKSDDDLEKSDELPELIHYFLKFSNTHRYFMILNVSRDICPYVHELYLFLRESVDQPDSDLDMQIMDVIFDKAVNRMIQGLKNHGADLVNKENFVNRYTFPGDTYNFNEILPKAKILAETFSQIRKSLWYFDDYGSVESFIKTSIRIQRGCSMLEPADIIASNHEILFEIHFKKYFKKLIDSQFMKADRPYWATYMFYLSIIDCVFNDLYHTIRTICNHVLVIAANQVQTNDLSSVSNVEMNETRSTLGRNKRSVGNEEDCGNHEPVHGFAITNSTERKDVFSNIENAEPTKTHDGQEKDANETDESNVPQDNENTKSESEHPSIKKSRQSRAVIILGCITRYRLNKNTVSLNGMWDEAGNLQECKEACEKKKKCKAVDYARKTQECSIHLNASFITNRIPHNDFDQYEIKESC